MKHTVVNWCEIYGRQQTVSIKCKTSSSGMAFAWIFKIFIFQISVPASQLFITAFRVVQAVVKVNIQSNGKGQILSPTSPKPLNWFWWNLKFRTTPEDYHHAEVDFDPTTWMVWASIQLNLPLNGFIVFWSLRHTHMSHQWTDFDDLYTVRRLSTQWCAFGNSLICLPI